MPLRQRITRRLNGESRPPGSPYLSYYDVCVTVEDMRSLKDDWLTDNNIAFWEEYLERETLPRFPQARIILLRPSMSLLLMRDHDLDNVRTALPDFSKATHAFLPLNDNVDYGTKEGGTHWSLLLVSILDSVAFHYDSITGSNFKEAILATRRLSEVMGRPIRLVHLDDCPQQDNGLDCGVFVCLLMRHLLVKRLLAANAREKVSMSMGGKMVDSTGGRKEMMRIIETLRKEGERRRSEEDFQKANLLSEKVKYEDLAGIDEKLITPTTKKTWIYIQKMKAEKKALAAEKKALAAEKRAAAAEKKAAAATEKKIPATKVTKKTPAAKVTKEKSPAPKVTEETPAAVVTEKKTEAALVTEKKTEAAVVTEKKTEAALVTEKKTEAAVVTEKKTEAALVTEKKALVAEKKTQVATAAQKLAIAKAELIAAVEAAAEESKKENRPIAKKVSAKAPVKAAGVNKTGQRHPSPPPCKVGNMTKGPAPTKVAKVVAPPKRSAFEQKFDKHGKGDAIRRSVQKAQESKPVRK